MFLCNILFLFLQDNNFSTKNKMNHGIWVHGFREGIKWSKVGQGKVSFCNGQLSKRRKFDGGFIVYDGNEKGYSWWVGCGEGVNTSLGENNSHKKFYLIYLVLLFLAINIQTCTCGSQVTFQTPSDI